MIAASNKSKPATIMEEKSMKKMSEQSKSQSVLNKPFDEALEFSQSGSEESVDTRASQTKNYMNEKLHTNDSKPASQPQQTPKQNVSVPNSTAVLQKSQAPITSQVLMF
jgi:hypothetical protein